MKNNLINFFIVVCILSLISCGIYIAYTAGQYKKTDDNYSTAFDSIVYGTTPDERSIDFDELQSDSDNHACCWIYIPDTMIDYPLVQASDNDVYLHKDAYGNDSVSGAIFLNCNNSSDLSDEKSIIFGHSMKNGSMFHALHSYSKKEFGIAHPTLYIYMDDNTYQTYNLLCTFIADSNDDSVYTVSDNDNASSCATLFLKRKGVAYGEDNGNSLILLSTCIKNDSRRVVVFQKE